MRFVGHGVLSPAGVSWGTLNTAKTSISLLSLPSKTNPHHYPYLSLIFLLMQPTSRPVMHIMFPPGLVYLVIGASDDEETILQCWPFLTETSSVVTF